MAVPSKLRISSIPHDTNNGKMTIPSRGPVFETACGAICYVSNGKRTKALRGSHLRISTTKWIIISTSETIPNHRLHTTTIGRFEPGIAWAGARTLTVKPTTTVSTALCVGTESPQWPSHNLRLLLAWLCLRAPGGTRASAEVTRSEATGGPPVVGMKDRTK